MAKKKLNTLSKFNPKNLNSDIILILYGISSINPRRVEVKNKNYYLLKKSIKKIENSILSEKIRQILIWKKIIQNKRKTNVRDLKQTLGIKLPSYSLDELIVEQFPNFSSAYKEFFRLIPLYFSIIQKNFLYDLVPQMLQIFIPFIIMFQFFLSNFVRLNRIIIIDEIYKLELDIKGRKTEIVLSRKFNSDKILPEKKIFKIIIDFKILLAQAVISKIYSFRKISLLGENFYRLNSIFEIWFNTPKRYYREKKYKTSNYPVWLKKQQNNFNIYYSLNSKKKKVKNIWNYSKNAYYKISNDKIKGYIFFTKKHFTEFASKIILFLSKLIFSKNKRDENLLFYFSYRGSRKYSLLSDLLFDSFIIDYINLKIQLPLLPYFKARKNLFSKGLVKQKKKKILARFPNNFKNFYCNTTENFFGYYFSVYKNKACMVNRHTTSFPDNIINLSFMIK